MGGELAGLVCTCTCGGVLVWAGTQPGVWQHVAACMSRAGTLCAICARHSALYVRVPRVVPLRGSLPASRLPRNARDGMAGAGGQAWSAGTPSVEHAHTHVHTCTPHRNPVSCCRVVPPPARRAAAWCWCTSSRRRRASPPPAGACTCSRAARCLGTRSSYTGGAGARCGAPRDGAVRMGAAVGCSWGWLW